MDVRKGWKLNMYNAGKIGSVWFVIEFNVVSVTFCLFDMTPIDLI